MYRNVPYSFQDQYYSGKDYNSQQYEGKRNKGKQMKLIGKAAVGVKPDMAEIMLGVITENMDLQAAIDENALKVRSVLNAIKSLGISDDEIKTSVFSVNPEYDYLEGKRVFKGYKVTNSIIVTIRNLEKVGSIINAAIANGANLAGNVNFTLSNPSLHYKRALELAVENAISKAEMLGKTLNVYVDKVPLRIDEQNYGLGAAAESKRMQLSEGAIPIMPGVMEVASSVEAVFNYVEF